MCVRVCGMFWVRFCWWFCLPALLTRKKRIWTRAIRHSFYTASTCFIKKLSSYFCIYEKKNNRKVFICKKRACVRMPNRHQPLNSTTRKPMWVCLCVTKQICERDREPEKRNDKQIQKSTKKKSAHTQPTPMSWFKRVKKKFCDLRCTIPHDDCLELQPLNNIWVDFSMRNMQFHIIFLVLQTLKDYDQFRKSQSSTSIHHRSRVKLYLKRFSINTHTILSSANR